LGNVKQIGELAFRKNLKGIDNLVFADWPAFSAFRFRGG
jgi:hypothetical protein